MSYEKSLKADNQQQQQQTFASLGADYIYLNV